MLFASCSPHSAGLPPTALRLIVGDVQVLPLEEDSCELVVSTLVSHSYYGWHHLRCFH